ncbi:MAG: FAD-binding protein [Granulosicoccaceae bacterium]
MTQIKTWYTDVLVVGGGGAATAATIAAHEAGARTMLAVKGRFGVPGVRGAGATSNPVGDYWTIRTIGPKGGFFNPPEAILSDMLQTGLGMANQALCEIFVEEAPAAIARLREMGMKFQSRMLATMPANDDNKTNNIVAIQKAIIEETQTQVLEGANLTDLIVENGVCHGAVGVDDNGEPFVVRCGAVVLATGGVGQMFQYSFNPPGNTGDGYAMAIRAGAELTNMEYMQQGIATTWPSQGIVMLYEMEDPYRLINRDGKAFLEDYLPDGVDMNEVCRQKSSHWPVSSRDDSIHLDRAIKAEGLKNEGLPAGVHAPVYLDMSRAERGFLPELFPAFMLEKGIDISKDLLQVQNHHHTSNGGVCIDEHGQSNITGLFAIGEASAWQGADRLGGTMLGGSQVFGWRAGAKAADVARQTGTETPLREATDAALQPLHQARMRSGDNTVDQLHKELQTHMWETLIVEKDEASLESARQAIANITDRLENDTGITQAMDHAGMAEMRNMLCVGKMITEAASMRTESRGSHFRSDFPTRDDTNWLTNIVQTMNSEGLQLRKQWLSEASGWVDQPNDVRITPWG